jgi:BCD family chlorophyll transporter-like MFS transporter
VALLLVVGSAPLDRVQLLMAGIVVLGLGVGMLETTNLALMMSMTDAQNAGMFMGAWGLAQAVGVGSGNVVGGALRDLGLLISGSHLAGYLTAFGFEIVVLIVAIPVLWRLSIRQFRATVETGTPEGSAVLEPVSAT